MRAELFLPPFGGGYEDLAVLHGLVEVGEGIAK